MIEESKNNLEFNIIINHIAKNCVSDLARLRMQNSEIIFSESDLKRQLSAVSETKEIYQAEGGLPIWSYVDIREILHKIEPIGSYLEISDCQYVQNFLEICDEIKKFFKKHSGKFLLLENDVSSIEILANLYQLLKNTIDPSGKIYDNASKDLKRIRSDIEYQRKQLHVILDRIKRKKAEHLQEDYITLREGRLVLPVREFSVNKIPGIVHGQSGTGQTHYIEPLEAVKLNNYLHELYSEEKNEIIKILRRITGNIKDYNDELIINFNIIIDLDVLQAKAKYSISANGNAPEISNDINWDIRKAFHPILLRKLSENAIPLNLKIGDDYRVLVISGPNAGGKTVVLKTIGLLQLMFQCGFHIPVEEGSKFPLCSNIFAVIGDDQSIENDLSTFSSHINNINKIFNSVSENSLVLIDEIGSGTDPTEGSALAIAILQKLNEDGIISIATTHQSALKEFAHKTENIKNAAMQFDIETLQPIFKIDVGLPGSSYAFEISERLGMDSDVLSSARKIMGPGSDKLEKIIIDLSRQKQHYEKEFDKISIKNSELDGLLNLYKQRSEELKKKKKQFEKKAREEADQILGNVNKTIENIISEIRESQAKPEIIKKSKKIINKLKKDFSAEQKDESKTKKIENLEIGQLVKSIKFDITGEVILINKDKNEIELESKGVRLKVPFEDLEIANSVQQTKQIKLGDRPIIKQVDNEIDLRGQRVEEAIVELEKYIDLAQLSGWKELRIIHGKGTGALRQSIQSYLKNKTHILSYRLAKYGEGDAGVTIIGL